MAVGLALNGHSNRIYSHSLTPVYSSQDGLASSAACLHPSLVQA